MPKWNHLQTAWSVLFCTRDPYPWVPYLYKRYGSMMEFTTRYRGTYSWCTAVLTPLGESFFDRVEHLGCMIHFEPHGVRVQHQFFSTQGIELLEYPSITALLPRLRLFSK